MPSIFCEVRLGLEGTNPRFSISPLAAIKINARVRKHNCWNRKRAAIHDLGIGQNAGKVVLQVIEMKAESGGARDGQSRELRSARQL
jgi:hypothetical protein